MAKVFSDIADPTIVDMLSSGKVGILRTDTLYGLVARADDESAVKRVYEIKERSEHKSPIVLLASIDDLYDKPTDRAIALINAQWPGPVSIIMDSVAAPTWIRRDNASVAYRVPDAPKLRQLLYQTGPLIAPSANPEGMPPAMTIAQAQDYFGADVDFYVDGGKVENPSPSKLIRLLPDGSLEQLR